MSPDAARHDSTARVKRLQRIVAAALLCLIGVTWKLWTPLTEFPRVPFAQWATGLPAWLDWVPAAVVVCGSIAVLVQRRDSRYGRAGQWLVVFGLPVSILLDQHRLQPWAYELWLILAIPALAQPSVSIRLLRIFVASIYVHSAVSKLDVAFFESHGRLLLSGLLDVCGLSDRLLPDAARNAMIGLFPVGELLVGAGLLIPRTRRWALVGSLAMHALLLITLGPLGLDHKPGVLVWNIAFIAQNLVLFGGSRHNVAAEPEGAAAADFRSGNAAAVVVAFVATAAPLLQPLGWFDNWPAWAVYSARPSVVEITVRDTRVNDLPVSLQAHVGPPPPLQEWRPVNIDAWSFAELDCPVYPQERYRLAVALAIADRAGLGDDMRVVLRGPPDRITGERWSTRLNGRDEIAESCSGFFINTQARRID